MLYFKIEIIDIISYSALLSFLITRIDLILHINEFFPKALLNAHYQLSAEQLMNIIQCTIYPREKLLFCSEIILNTITPIIILKYLIIFCLISLIYLIFAYLIKYCINRQYKKYDCDILQCKNKCDDLYLGFCVPKNYCSSKCTFCEEKQLQNENLFINNNKIKQNLSCFRTQTESVPKCASKKLFFFINFKIFEFV